MQRYEANGSVLAIVGAGPKGIAVAVKACVLREIGIRAPRVVLIERSGIGAHWSGEHGFTDGELKLGTSPEKDLVFPLETELGVPALNQRLQQRLLAFGWTAFLSEERQLADWVDRGRPAPSHRRWADYLRWAVRKLGDGVELRLAELRRAELDPAGERWILEAEGREGTVVLAADSLMFTGPGKARLDFLPRSAPMPSGVDDIESFWKCFRRGAFPRSGKVVVVGTGENAASVLLALSRFSGGLELELLSPRGFVATRAENSYENRFYSQPEKAGWGRLSLDDRREFIRRTDLGVFSVDAMHALSGERTHRIRAGRLTDIRSAGGRLALSSEYQGVTEELCADRAVLATGMDQLSFLRSVLGPRAWAALRAASGEEPGEESISRRIGPDLALTGMSPRLQLPMLAGLAQGPGFSNLSCLGLLSDRILQAQPRAVTRPLRELELSRAVV